MMSETNFNQRPLRWRAADVSLTHFNAGGDDRDPTIKNDSGTGWMHLHG